MPIELLPRTRRNIAIAAMPAAGSRWKDQAGKAFASVLALALLGSLAVGHGFAAATGALGALVLAAAVYSALRVRGLLAVEAAFASVLMLAAVSFLGSLRGPATVVVALAAVAVLAWKRRRIGGFLAEEKQMFAALTPWDLSAWLFVALMVVAWGMSFPKGFSTVEPLHPVYELSIGQSFQHALFGTPDLSYLDKTIRYHPLSTQLPLYLSNVFGVPLLSATYTAAPLLILGFGLILVAALFSAHPGLRTPAFVLFFLPILNLNLFTSEGLFLRFNSSLSYGLSMILAVAAADFLVRGRRGLLMMAMAAMLLTKAPFFITFLGGLFLYFLRKKDFKSIALHVSVCALIFAAVYPVFMSKAHAHNLWVPGPFFLHQPIVPIALAIWLAMAASAAAAWVLAKEDAFLALASISLSGVLGTALLTEMTESNSSQFINACFIFLPILFWWVMHRALPAQSPFLRLGRLAVYAVVLISIAVVGRARIFRLANAWAFNVAGAPLPIGKIPGLNVKDRINNPEFPADLIDAYAWLGVHSPKDSRVLFGRHYEGKHAGPDLTGFTGYIRTAMSGRQVYSEGDKYKGVGMQEDYPARTANSVHFYRNFVVSSAVSARLLDAFYASEYGARPGRPLSQSESEDIRRLYRLSLKKEWSWLNIEDKLSHETRGLLQSLPVDPGWMKDFLKEQGIDYVMLENGDTPAPGLQEISEVVFSNPSVKVLKIRKERLGA